MKLCRTYSAFLTVMIFCGVASFLTVEYIFGAKPCLLCSMQRIPYYAGFAIGLLGVMRERLSPFCLGILGLVFFCAVCIGIFHILVENGTVLFSCNAGQNFASVEELRHFLYTNKAPDCTVPYTILGFRMSVLATIYSAIISLASFILLVKASSLKAPPAR